MYPTVSVAIITYNQKLFLRECIESVLRQDYRPLEIVVADDGSNDGTQELLLDYKREYPDLFKLVLSKNNCGITKNSNAAFFNCTGKYIAWLGGDDLMLPTKLRKQVAFLEANSTFAICYHDMEVFETKLGKGPRTLGNYNSGLRALSLHQGGIGSAEILVESDFMAASSVMTRRESCPSSGFDERLNSASDWLFFVQTAFNGKIGHLPETLGRYRRHENNFSNNMDRFDQDYFMTLDIIEQNRPDLFKHIRRARGRYFLRLSFRIMKKGRVTMSLKYFTKSIRLGLLSWKTFFWFILSPFRT